MTLHCLCIGGPKDGQWETVGLKDLTLTVRDMPPPLPPTHPPSAPNMEVRGYTYRRRELFTGRESVYIFIEDSLTEHDAFMRLLTYYAPRGL